ncbi:MAG: aromatic amino acid lyase, partial [Lawsonibacter sp.]|nr:aromatic amino acid lyase [Lawsonibacter sp.]
MNQKVQLGGQLSLEAFMDVVRNHAVVTFSPIYEKRVHRCRDLVEKWVDEGRVMYGTTTGFGSLVSQVI